VKAGKKRKMQRSQSVSKYALSNCTCEPIFKFGNFVASAQLRGQNQVVTRQPDQPSN